MNYPVHIKKVFTRIRFSAHDVWQNLRELKRSITNLVRNIDDMDSCLIRSRQIVQGLHGKKTARGQERISFDPAHNGHVGHESWASCPGGES